jgi:Ca2+-binding RTX toxin-like protein
MAQIIAFTAFDMNDFPFATGPTIYPIVTSTHIQETGFGTEANYYGTGFSVVGSDILSGTLRSADYSENGVLQFEVTGLNHDASVVWDYIVSEDAAGLYTYALSGPDTFTGSPENDTLFGYSGNDVVIANGGADVVYGGDGIDTLKGGDGNDALFGDAGSDKLKGNDDNDFAIGGGGADTLAGGPGSDLLDGGSGSDTVKGGGGADLLIGSGGKDRLEGGGDDDILSGGNGVDVLVGGAGADCFWFYAAGSTHTDVITDFTGAGPTEGDVICLNDIFFTVLTVGPLAESNFVSGAGVSALDADDYVLYNTSTGALLYDADGSGPEAAVRFATVSGSPDGLDYTDFEVV